MYVLFDLYLMILISWAYLDVSENDFLPLQTEEKQFIFLRGNNRFVILTFQEVV